MSKEPRTPEPRTAAGPVHLIRSEPRVTYFQSGWMLALPATGSKRASAEVIRCEGICHVALHKSARFVPRAGGGGAVWGDKKKKKRLGGKLNPTTLIQGAVKGRFLCHSSQRERLTPLSIGFEETVHRGRGGWERRESEPEAGPGAVDGTRRGRTRNSRYTKPPGGGRRPEAAGGWRFGLPAPGCAQRIALAANGIAGRGRGRR